MASDGTPQVPRNLRTRTGSRQAPLAMDAEAFRKLAHSLVDQVADLLSSVPERPVTPNETPFEVRRALDLNCSLPEEGAAPGPLL